MGATRVVLAVVALGLATSMLVACSGDDGGGDSGSGGTAGISGAGAGAGGLGGTGAAGGGAVFDAGSDPARNNVTAGAICDRFAQIQCAGEQFCCSAPGRERAACEAAAASACKDDLLLDAVSANPVAAFDAASASAAFMNLETRASMCDVNLGQWGVSVDGFLGTVAGTVAAGGDCTAPDGLAGDLGDILAALASCTDAATTACLPTETTWTCEPRAAAGGACFSDFNCQDGLFCDPPFATGSVCTARKATGMPCVLANECQSFICKSGACGEATVDNAYCPE